jgi:deazaflavin-dependent oxidoreductase (nitroreductase family)
VSSAFGGLPVIMLTTTGARTSLPRTVPLLGIPVDADLALIGSGFGQAPTPAWVRNLQAEPRAVVACRDRRAEVVAVPAPDPDRVWVEAARIYPGYPLYRDRLENRVPAVFMLEPAGSFA